MLSDVGTDRVAGLVAESVITHFREPFRCGTHRIACTASMGIAIRPTDWRRRSGKRCSS